MRYLALSVLVTVLDQTRKYLSENRWETMALIPGLLGLHPTRNTGVAFSFLEGSGRLGGLVSLVFVIFGLWALYSCGMKKKFRTGAVLMISGAFSNMLDRFFLGYVRDMIEILAFRFAVFNVADCAVVVGCGIMILSLLGKGEAVWKKK